MDTREERVDLMVQALGELKQRLEHSRPVAWGELPDLRLYKDQVLGYMPRQLIQYREEESLTGAMVNNYVKDGFLPRPEGKRYTREHLAALTELGTLKQVLSVKDAGFLVRELGREQEAGYAYFRRELDTALKETAERIGPGLDRAELAQQALSLALHSYAESLACQRIIDLLQQEEQSPEKPRKKRRKEHENA